MNLLSHTAATGTPTRRLQLPADDGPMPDEPVQWWYWTGHLDTVPQAGELSRRFGFEMVFFDFTWPNTGVRGLMGHAAITDVSAGRFIYDEHLRPIHLQTVNRGHFDLSLDKEGPLFRTMEVASRTAARTAWPESAKQFSRLLRRIRPDGWRSGNGQASWCPDNAMAARGGDGQDHLRAFMDGYELKLSCSTADPPLQYYGGWAHGYQAGGYTYYYSRPRMAASGSLRLPDGTVHQLTGRAWFDRQAGELDAVIKAGYQWFALSFDNGDDVMVAKLKVKPGDQGPHVDNYAAVRTGGKLFTLGPKEFSVAELASWRSPATGRDYPCRWEVALPAHGIHVTVAPCLQNQELVPPTWWYSLLETAYWEGTCDVFAADGSALGRAYVEVSNW